MSSASVLSPAQLDVYVKQLAGLRVVSPNVLFFISRSKNQNIVVYEALLGGAALSAAKPVDVYWLDIDPEYVKAARKKGVTTDRNDLNMLENQFAYGVSSEAIATGAAGRYACRLVALPDKPLTVFIDADGKLHAQTTINGKLVDLITIYVNATDRMMRTPKVEYVDIIGIDAEGNIVHERMIPK